MKDLATQIRPTKASKNYSHHLLKIICLQASKIIKFMTSTSLFLSLNASLVVIFSFLVYGHSIAPEIVLVAFLVTFSIYSLNKATDKVEDTVNSPNIPSRSHLYYVTASVSAMIACFSIGALDGLNVFLVLSMPFVIGLVYSVRVVKTLPRLKEITGVKSLSVALSWAVTGALLPIALGAVEFQKVIFVFAFIFIQVLVKEVIFDFLDMRGDKVSGVTTIPMVLGKKRTKFFLVIINTFSGLLVMFSILSGLIIQFVSLSIFGVLFSFLIIWLFVGNDHKRFHGGLVVERKWIPLAGLIKAILR
jgi:4-hydroxybenzoate polyprenyltransferase